MGTGAPELSPKHEAFAQAYVRLNDGCAAYVEVYGCKKASAKRAAIDLLDNPNIIARVKDLQEKVAERTEITAASLIKELEKDRELAREANQFNASIGATEKIGKLLGLFVDKNETTVSMRPDDARKTVEQLAGKYLPGGSK